MFVKRILLSALTAVCAVSLLAPTVFAHGGCHGARRTAQPCAVEDCTLTGRHVHDGVTYCGADHASGYCDGSCPFYQASASSGVRYGGHHGCHR